MRYIIITTEEELLESWSDPRLPNMSNSFIEKELEECEDNGDGTYTASYNLFIVTEPREVLYLKHETSEQDPFAPAMSMMPTDKPGEYSYILEPGEYLRHPRDTTE